MTRVVGGVTDRPPFTLTLSAYGARLTGCPLRTYYSDPEVYVAGQVAVREALGPDLLFSPFALALLGEPFGSTLAWFDHQPPNLDRPAVPTVAEAARLPLPDVDAHPTLLFLRESVRRLARAYKGDVPVVGMVLCPVDLPPLIVGLDAWMDAVVSRDPAVPRLLERCTCFFVEFGNALLGDGAAFLAFPGVFCSPAVLPMSMLTSLVLPVLAEAFQQVRGPLVWHHGGIRLAPHLEALRGLPNVIGYAVDSSDSLAQARQVLGEGPVLLGNLDGPSLDQRSPDEVHRQARAILLDRARDPRFILASSAADVPMATPLENLHAVREAVLSFHGMP